MSKMKNEVAYCIFCGRPGVTKQHLWPDWMKAVVPRHGSEHSQEITRFSTSIPGVVVMQPELHGKRGPFGARKIRKVCGPCNSGWMSRLETSAKQCLTDLMLGNDISINAANQSALAAWGAMISVIAEYTDIPTQSIPVEHRRHLMEHGTPPEGWFIWIAAYKGENWKQRYRHHGLAASTKADVHLVRPAYNTQFSTFVVGSLFLHTASTTLPISPSFFSSLDGQISKIWPPNTTSVEFSGRDAMSDDCADRVADFLFNSLAFPPAGAKAGKS